MRRRNVIAGLVIAIHVLGLISAVHAVMTVRTPQGSIAWAIPLITFPYVTVPAYWVFGRSKFQGYVLARRSELAAVDDVLQRAKHQIDIVNRTDDWVRTAITATERLARIPFTGNNDLELLVDGEATFQSIFAGIQAANEYVLVQFYIVRDDDIGRELKTRLIEKAADGVKVYFLYDEIGSLGLPRSYTQELSRGGVRVLPFHSRKGSGNRFQLNFRNHRKTVIVDGRVAWIGGHNVGDEYLGRSEEFGSWRDTHVRVEGPAVIGAQLAFVEDWRWAADESLSELTWRPHVPADGVAHAVVIASGPADAMETASLMYTQAINTATRRIWIASPYFVPDDAIVQALQLAALRGVDVRILIPENSDFQLIKLAAYSYFREIKMAGVKFYRYQRGFLHEKVTLVDDNVAFVGTVNFDNRSFRLNFEITVLAVDSEFANDVEKMFQRDFADSRIMARDEYDEKSFWFKFAVRVSRLAAPVL